MFGVNPKTRVHQAEREDAHELHCVSGEVDLQTNSDHPGTAKESATVIKARR
jgi:hypothetical protein